MFKNLFNITKRKIWKSYSYFKDRGIKTPPIEFFFGNFRQTRKHTYSAYSDTLYKWTKQYGKLYGWYEGHIPVYVTSDLDLIQEIFIKQYGNFSARKKFPLALRDDDPSLGLFLSIKSKWKRMRVIMNPTFSTSKLREIGPLVNRCIKRLIDVLNKEEQEILISEFYKKFTMDTICNIAFGIDIDIQNNPKNEYFTKAEEVFNNIAHLNIVAYLANFLLILNSVVEKLNGNKSLYPHKWINDRIYNLVEQRINNKVNNVKRRDFIQLLLDAQAENIDNFDDASVELVNISLNKKLTSDEIKMNLTDFLLAGYETTSGSLGTSSYVLATNPEEQIKLYEEINSFYSELDEGNLNNLSIDIVNKMEYLDMFVKEVLRCYPIGILTRRCTNATNVKGIDFPEGMLIDVDVLSVHYDPDIWGPVDPKLFYPLRFSPEIKRHPCAFLAFGIGPRNCIGMKFALMEIKMALVNLVKNYEILKGENTPAVLEFSEGIVRTPINGISVILKKRN